MSRRLGGRDKLPACDVMDVVHDVLTQHRRVACGNACASVFQRGLLVERHHRHTDPAHICVDALCCTL